MPGEVSKGPGNRIGFGKAAEQGSQTNLFKGHAWHSVLKAFPHRGSGAGLSSFTCLGKSWQDSPLLKFLRFYGAVWTCRNKI